MTEGQPDRYSIDYEKFQAKVDEHPIPDRTFTYGTSGFRCDAALLDGIVFRIGILAALRAQALKQNVGVCITASHNPHKDNGVKIVDGSGEMLQGSWEPHATLLANAKDTKAIEEAIQQICDAEGVHVLPEKQEYQVLVARDTRTSGPGLVKACIDGCLAVDQKHVDLGIQTTPQFHYCVRESNRRHVDDIKALEQEYEDGLVTGFLRILTGKEEAPKVNTNSTVLMDCANGVGTQVLKSLAPRLEGVLGMELYNTNTDEETKLNHECGADMVQKEQSPPSGIPEYTGKNLVTIDGDADRVVYFQLDESKNFRLLDGDKIITIYSIFIRKQLEILGIKDLTMGVVQTAYANGGSTIYITNELKVTPDCVPTGVKHLHHKALDYDIGIYFEANGHGTVVFSDHCQGLLEERKGQGTPEQQEAVVRLLAAPMVVHPTVGDAIGDMLMVEACLYVLGWTAEQWQDVYADLPSKQVKVKVPDPKQVVTVWDETRVTSPEGLQEDIDAVVQKYPSGRAFVRPSGTEPVVRIYAEASTPEAVAEIVAAVEVALNKAFEPKEPATRDVGC